MFVIYEYLKIENIIKLCIQNLINNNHNVIPNKLYWIDASFSAKIIAALFHGIIGVSFEKLDFQIKNVIGSEGEQVRFQIMSQDLFWFRDSITEGDNFSNLKLNDNRLLFYLQKSILDGEIPHDKDAPSRLLYLIHMVAQAGKGSPELLFVLRNRPWKKQYEEYAKKLEVRLQWAGLGLGKIDFRIFVKKQIRRSSLLYKFLNRILNGRTNSGTSFSQNNLFVEGPGNYNLNTDGKKSDFHWLTSSAFPRDRVVYLCQDSKCQKTLDDDGIYLVTRSDINPAPKNNNSMIDALTGFSLLEKREIKRIVKEYLWERRKWIGFFKQKKIKVFMTWYRWDAEHAAMADAIRTQGGISTVNQVSFDGYRSFECQLNIDVLFGWSGWSATVERQLGSYIPYFVNTGYSNDHTSLMLEKAAKKLRNQLKQAGARKIICVLDENSLEDVRWHTGHKYQSEHYRYVLERVLDTPWLGAIFKPKNPGNLRQRLGPVNELLLAAEKTGRCMVMEKKHYVSTVEPVLLAGLAADLCIHGHLCAGTAALECALKGIPALLINREKITFSKLNELPKGKVVFNDWPSTIEAVMDHFQTPGGIPGFGDWSNIINELDSYRDGKGAQRIGTYLKWLIDGFNQGLDRELILADAASRYADKWGVDKVVSIGTNYISKRLM